MCHINPAPSPGMYFHMTYSKVEHIVMAVRSCPALVFALRRRPQGHRVCTSTCVKCQPRSSSILYFLKPYSIHLKIGVSAKSLCGPRFQSHGSVPPPPQKKPPDTKPELPAIHKKAAVHHTARWKESCPCPLIGLVTLPTQ